MKIRTYPVPLLLAMVSLAGCASYGTREHVRELAVAQQDDADCVQQGWKYPEPHYVSCRLKLQNDRLYKNWMNLQLMHQTQNQPINVPPPYPYQDTYRPLDPDYFSCRLVTENNTDYVLCREDESANP